MRHEGTVKGRMREEAAGCISDCGLRIADLTAKNTARPAAPKEWNHPDSESGDFTDRKDFSTQSRQGAAQQSRNQRRIGRKRTHRSQRKKDISPCLCDLCVPLRQKFCWNCMILGYSTAKTQGGKPFLLFAFPISAFVFAPLRLRAFAFKKSVHLGLNLYDALATRLFRPFFLYLYDKLAQVTLPEQVTH